MEDFNKTEKPLVSVIVPVYNAEDFIKNCLESVEKQTYDNIEIIVVNDGSSDNSLKFCKNFKSLSKRTVLIIDQKNQGSSVARNEGIEASNGDYICFIDGDDWIVSKMIETLVCYLEENNLKLVEFGHTNTSSKKETKKEIEFSVESRESAFERVVKNQTHAVWKRIYSKDIIGDFKFNIGKLHQDHHFTLEMISRVETMGITTENFYYYLTSNESVTRSEFNKKKIFSMDQILYLNDYRSFFNDKTQILATNNILVRLRYYYHEFFRNPKLDQDLKHRKQIKKWFEDNYNKEHVNNLRYSLIMYCPIKLYRYVYLINNFF